MQALEKENDPEVLRALMKVVIAHNEKLQKQIDDFRNQQALAAQLKLNISDALAVLHRIIFGKRSEKRGGA